LLVHEVHKNAETGSGQRATASHDDM